MDQGVDAGRVLRDAVEYWTKFVRACISKAPDDEFYEQMARNIYKQNPLPPAILADLFFHPQPDDQVSLVPRMPLYIRILHRLGFIDSLSILRSMYKVSALHDVLKKSGSSQEQNSNGHQDTSVGDKESRRWSTSSWFEEFFFFQIIKAMTDGTPLGDTKDMLELCQIASQWMDLFTSTSNFFAADVLGQLQESRSRDPKFCMEESRDAFVPLLVRLVETPLLVKTISMPIAKGARKQLSDSMWSFLQTLQPSGLVDRLQIFYTDTLTKLDPDGKKKQAAASAAMEEILETTVGVDNFVIPDLPVPNTRAALYVFLNACLVGRPLIDDNVLISYIHNRYQDQTQAGVIDLILASFDILANAIFRNEGSKDSHVLKSFLVCKVPLLICQLCSAGFDMSTSEYCITEALNQVDTSVFPTASLMFDPSRSNNPYTESVREDFCTACVVHGLIQREHVDRILGESSMSYVSLEKLSKEKLVQDCLASTANIQSLIRDLDKTDGNVGAVAQALVDVMRRLCHNKETISLKMVCSQLAQKPQALDVLLLFEKLPSIVEPLCQVLDNWQYEEDQGEYQPIYEEFGSILLVVLAFAYRYNLSPFDMGIASPDSSVAKIVNWAHISRDPHELSAQQKEHVNGWIEGLFDNESGGLGDDLMSSCPPPDFYSLVASIFQRIIVAYTVGYLNDDALKGGIEYLVDTFLLPSLVPAMRFLADYLWVEQSEQKAVIKILQLLLLPSSISGEASAMLSSVCNLVAKPLEHSLRTYQRQDPKNQDIEPLLIALKDSLPLSRRTGGADHLELETWANSSGLSGALRHTIQGLVQWAMNPAVNNMPTSYTHRQLIVFVQVTGASRTLQMLLEEIRMHAEAGNPSVVYDVVAAMICAPNVQNEAPSTDGMMMDASGNIAPPVQRSLTLRQALGFARERARKVSKEDALLAEIIVRLHRRVEAHMVMPQPPAILAADAGIPLDLAAGAAGLGDVDALAVAGVGADGVGLDMGLGGPGSAGGLDSTSDGDLFGGLDMNMDSVYWDSMELTGN